MRLLVGLPMHNAANCVVHALERLPKAMERLGAEWQVLLVDDNSDEDQIQCVMDHVFRAAMLGSKLVHRVTIARAHDLWPTSPAPNLGKVLNWCLDHVGSDVDYYLNVESDVFLDPDTLVKLVEAMQDTGAPMACPTQRTHTGAADFIFWGAGIVTPEQLVTSPHLKHLLFRQRPKWCNLGCLLVRGDVARDPCCRVDERFRLFCCDGDYTATVAQVHGRPVYEPKAVVTHVGRQSTREGQAGGHTAHEAVQMFDAKWAAYLAGGLFGS